MNNQYPQDVVREAKLRKMKPEDYLRELEECSAAETRLAEIDQKKLDEMQPPTEEEADLVL